MKFKRVIGGVLLGVSVAASAQDSPWNVTGFVSYLDPDSDRIQINTLLPVEDDIGFAGALGYRFTPKWEGRAIFNQWDLGNTVKGYGLDGLYHFNDKQLYGIVGYKHADITGDDDEILNLGLGKRFALTERWYFTAEALVNQSLKDSFNDYGLNVGLTYFFGEKATPAASKPVEQPIKQPVAPVVRKDSDGDGVYDDSDACPHTPMEDAVDGSGCTRYTMADETIQLHINFANNDDRVEQSYYSEIERVAEFMKNYPSSTVVIEGHTSIIGKADYNQKLSERRAQKVAAILIERFGVSAARVSHVGYGESRLKDAANTPTAHQQNRRIEARISGSKRVKVKR